MFACHMHNFRRGQENDKILVTEIYSVTGCMHCR